MRDLRKSSRRARASQWRMAMLVPACFTATLSLAGAQELTLDFEGATFPSELTTGVDGLPWALDDQSAHSGLQSMSTPELAAGQWAVASLPPWQSHKPITVTWSGKIASSESAGDLTFTVDGRAAILVFGPMSWASFTTRLLPGEYRFAWRHLVPGFAFWTEQAWIDDIRIGPTVPGPDEIRVSTRAVHFDAGDPVERELVECDAEGDGLVEIAGTANYGVTDSWFIGRVRPDLSGIAVHASAEGWGAKLDAKRLADGTCLLAIADDKFVHGYDMGSGRHLFEIRLPDTRGAMDLVVVPGAASKQATLVLQRRARPSCASCDDSVHAIDPWSGRELWRRDIGIPSHGLAVAPDEQGSASFLVVAATPTMSLSLDTGELRWQSDEVLSDQPTIWFSEPIGEPVLLDAGTTALRLISGIDDGNLAVVAQVAGEFGPSLYRESGEHGAAEILVADPASGRITRRDPASLQLEGQFEALVERDGTFIVAPLTRSNQPQFLGVHSRAARSYTFHSMAAGERSDDIEPTELTSGKPVVADIDGDGTEEVMSWTTDLYGGPSRIDIRSASTMDLEHSIRLPFAGFEQDFYIQDLFAFDLDGDALPELVLSDNEDRFWGQRLLVIDPVSGQVEPLLEDAILHGFDLTMVSQSEVVESTGLSVRKRNLFTDEVVWETTEATGRPGTSIDFDGDGFLDVVVYDRSGSDVLSGADGRLLWQPVAGTQFDPWSGLLAYPESRTARILDAATREPVASFPLPPGPHVSTVFPVMLGNRLVAIFGGEGYLAAADASDGRILAWERGPLGGRLGGTFSLVALRASITGDGTALVLGSRRGVARLGFEAATTTLFDSGFEDAPTIRRALEAAP